MHLPYLLIYNGKRINATKAFYNYKNAIHLVLTKNISFLLHCINV